MARLLTVLDRAYERYSDVTGGREPERFLTHEGRATIAIVPSTCGAGCAYLGQTGIEIMEPYWWHLWSGVAERDEFDQIPFYELGRNFWFLSDKLGYVEPDNGGAIVTGFAVLNRFIVMDALGIKAGPFNGEPFASFRARVVELVSLYEADHSLTWDNTLRVGKGVPGSGLGSTDLFASMMMWIAERCGPAFYDRVWVEAQAQPDRRSTLDAVENLVRAASSAAGDDLSETFVQRWRFPTLDAE